LLAGRLDARSGVRAQDDAVLVVREALRRRYGDEGGDRCGAGVRRLRLHQGVPGREAHARREAVPDLRGYVTDPAARERKGNILAACRLTSTSPGGSPSSRAARAGSAAPMR